MTSESIGGEDGAVVLILFLLWLLFVLLYVFLSCFFFVCVTSDGRLGGKVVFEKWKIPRVDGPVWRWV